MKISTQFFIIILLLGCKTQNVSINPENDNANLASVCSENGKCVAKLIPNSFLQLNTDSIEKLYATIEGGSNIVFKFTYNKTIDKKLVDAQYTEEIYFEFDPNISNLNLKNDELQNVKLTYNKICFCKDSTGFHPIKIGELSIDKIEPDTYIIKLNFQIDEVSTVVTSINEILKLK